MSDKRRQLVLYQSEDGGLQLEAKLEAESIWLSMAQIAALFHVNVPAVSKHIKNIYAARELSPKATVSKMETVRQEGTSDEILKESLWERIKAAYYRGRTQGLVRGIVPQIRGTVMLILLLAFLVIVVRYWFPTDFYAGLLRSVRRLLDERGMTIVPDLIGRLLESVGGKGP